MHTRDELLKMREELLGRVAHVDALLSAEPAPTPEETKAETVPELEAPEARPVDRRERRERAKR